MINDKQKINIGKPTELKEGETPHRKINKIRPHNSMSNLARIIHPEINTCL